MGEAKYTAVSATGGVGVAGASGAATYTWFGDSKTVDLNKAMGAINKTLKAISDSGIHNKQVDEFVKKLTQVQQAITTYQQQQACLADPQKCNH